MKSVENDIVLFTDGNIQLEVPVSQDGESVWLSANQMAVLFVKDETNIRKHINNIFKSSAKYICIKRILHLTNHPNTLFISNTIYRYTSNWFT